MTDADGTRTRKPWAAGSTLGHQLTFSLLLLLCCSSLVATVNLLREHLGAKQHALDEKRIKLREATSAAVREIDALLREVMDAADQLAGEMSQTPPAGEAMLARLRETLADPHFYGGTITFSPFAHDPEQRLYSIYYWRQAPGAPLEFLQLDEQYDYTNDEYDWYVVPMANGNCWGEPYYDEAGETFMTTYSSVFTDVDPKTGKRRNAGVVTVDLSMNEIRRVIEGLDLGASGFGALTTREGTYLYHPREEYVTEHRTLLDIAKEKNDPDRVIMARAAREGKAGNLNHLSTTTGQESWLIFESVPTSGWSLQNTFIRIDLINVNAWRHQLIQILGALIVFSISLLSLALGVQHGLPRPLWTVSIVSSLLFAGATAYIWSLALDYSSTEALSANPVSDRMTLRRIVAAHENDRLNQDRPLPAYIPTGVHIETLELTATNDLMLSGSIWQRYGPSVPKDVPRKFRFANANQVEITNVTEYAQNGETVVLSSFVAAIRQNLDNTEYPLDEEMLRLRLLPAEIDERVALIPDLSGYRLLSPSLLPGLDEDATLAGWSVLQSFFELRQLQSYTSLGLEQSFDAVQFPTLHFNMVIRRNFLHSFVSNLTPLILVAVMLFAILLLAGEVDYGRALSMCVAMLFVIVFSHIGIRNDIQAENVFYLEYFYFIIYMAVLWVALSSIQKPLGLDVWLFRYRNGLLPRVFFWPFTMGSLLVITTCTFY